MPIKKSRHSTLLIINFTYLKKVYPIVNRFKLISIKNNPVTEHKIPIK